MQLPIIEVQVVIRLNAEPGGCIGKKIDLPALLPAGSLVRLPTPIGARTFQFVKYRYSLDVHERELIAELEPLSEGDRRQMHEHVAYHPGAWDFWSECKGWGVRDYSFA